MPPSRHSSSSHSSSHRSSSSRSSSSHRSSSHSRSSHSSSYSRSSYSRNSGYHSRPTRTRRNQPSGYTGSGTKHHYGRVHDYVYYPTSWVDTATGISYKKGYYDEEGTHYDYVAFKKNEAYETMLTCDYCGTEIKAKWTTGVTPQCPNCGANLQEVVMHTAMDEEVPESSYYSDSGRTYSRMKKPLIIIIIVFFLAPFANSLLLIPLQAFSHVLRKTHKETENTNRTAVTTTVQENDEIYIDEIGRTCYWDAESESYYDSTTDCYFWYNTELDPPQWQYWYEGISSDYGDYGWMEYDAEEGKWYIEESADNWIVLPDSYDTSHLWYTESVGD